MKTILFPVYHDIDKLSIYKNVIPEDYHVIIYEKKDIQHVEKVTTVLDFHRSISQYHIPSIGEQHFSLVLYIIRNYTTLHGTLHFSKTNWIPHFSNKTLFREDLMHIEGYYKQHSTERKFICIFPDKQIHGFKEGIVDLVKCNPTMVHSSNLNCISCNSNEPCYQCGLFMVDTFSFIFTTSYIKKNDRVTKLLENIFHNYSPVTEFDPCVIDSSYCIDSKVLLYHPKEVYIKLLDTIVTMCHDECNIFFHLFFKETLSRLNGWNKLPI